MVRSGRADGIPYSLSRWTDVVASKWDWFRACLKAGQMVAFDPKSIAPQAWSLAPEDTLGLVFWTKNPRMLVRTKHIFEEYDVSVHMTATGWEEAEEGAPGLRESALLLADAAKAFKKVYWRFSPVPLLPNEELLRRFSEILMYAALSGGLDRVYVSFLQENDRMPETRTGPEKSDILNMLADKAAERDVRVILCSDDQSLVKPGVPFETGHCVPESDFPGAPVSLEDCGCVLMADPFTINEACLYKCAYCYTADSSLSAERRDTT